MKLAKIIFSIFIISTLFCCQKKVNFNELEFLLENDKIISETRYAVICPEFLRLRKQPTMQSTGIATLYQHDLVQVILMVNQTGGWCRIASSNTEGWLPVKDLMIFDSYQSALKFQKSQRGHLGKK